MLHYAGNGHSVDGGIAAYEAALKENKKKYESFTYEGKQHGFHNDTTPRHDPEAAKLAGDRTLDFLRKISSDRPLLGSDQPRLDLRFRPDC